MTVITYKGLQVPWVTRWNSEKRDDVYTVSPDGYHLIYHDERPEDRMWNVLWLRQGISQGVGEPEFKQVHTYRQRDAMFGHLCQVCGRTIEGQLTWLMPKWALKFETIGKGRVHTSTPATCEDCIPIARAMCPHLTTHETVILDVTGWRPWGVFGDIASPNRETSKVAVRQGEVSLIDERLPLVLGRQVVVEIYDFRKRKEHN